MPVLAGRDEAVEVKLKELFPRTTRYRGTSTSNAAGLIAGRAAAELATLGPEQEQLAAS